MLQATVRDGLAFDALTFGQDCLGSPKVDISRGEVVDALMIADVIVMLEEGADLPLEVAGKIIFVEQGGVLQRLMPALDLPLGLGMIRSPAHVLHVFALEPRGQI